VLNPAVELGACVFRRGPFDRAADLSETWKAVWFAGTFQLMAQAARRFIFACRKGRFEPGKIAAAGL